MGHEVKGWELTFVGENGLGELGRVDIDGIVLFHRGGGGDCRADDGLFVFVGHEFVGRLGHAEGEAGSERLGGRRVNDDRRGFHFLLRGRLRLGFFFLGLLRAGGRKKGWDDDQIKESHGWKVGVSGDIDRE